MKYSEIEIRISEYLKKTVQNASEYSRAMDIRFNSFKLYEILEIENIVDEVKRSLFRENLKSYWAIWSEYKRNYSGHLQNVISDAYKCFSDLPEDKLDEVVSGLAIAAQKKLNEHFMVVSCREQYLNSLEKLVNFIDLTEEKPYLENGTLYFHEDSEIDEYNKIVGFIRDAANEEIRLNDERLKRLASGLTKTGFKFST